jgi:hypothetical protein
MQGISTLCLLACVRNLIPVSALTDEIVDWALKASTYELKPETKYSAHELTFSQSDTAIGYLCHLKSPVTSNILHLVAQKQDISVTMDARCPEFESLGTTIEISFEHQRDLALLELRTRGNPPYQVDAYKKSS